MATAGAADALSSLGGDLTFSVSWSVATELLDAARETQLGEAELIAIVLGASVVLGALPKALPKALSLVRAEAARFWKLLATAWRRIAAPSEAQAELAQNAGSAGDAAAAGTWKASTTRREADAPAVAAGAAPATAATEASGIVAFLGLFVGIFQRISVSIVVQLLAANVRTQQPLRAVRVLTLLSVAVFFLFLEATGKVGRMTLRLN